MHQWQTPFYFIASFSLLLTAPISHAEQTQTLFEVYQLATTNDPKYLSSEANYLAQKESNIQSWAAIYPQISLSAYKSSVSRNRPNRTPSSESFNNDGFSLRITQALYRQGDFDRISQSNAIVIKAQADFDIAKYDLILRVAENYFKVLAAQDNLNFSNAEKKALSHQLLQTKQKFEVGVIAITDVYESQARYDQSVAQVIAAKNLLQIAHENLRELTGQIHDKISHLTQEIPLQSPSPEDINEWIKLALANNLSLKAANQFMLIAQKEIDIQRSGHLPTLDLVAERSNSNIGGSFLGELEQSSISLQFNLPIFEGGRVTSKTAQARYQYNAAKQQHIQSLRATERLARSGYLNVLASISQVKALKQAVFSSKKALETTQAGLEVGTRTTVDVLNSQRELFRAKKNYANERYNYLQKILLLKQAAGILSAADIHKISQWIQ